MHLLAPGEKAGGRVEPTRTIKQLRENSNGVSFGKLRLRASASRS